MFRILLFSLFFAVGGFCQTEIDTTGHYQLRTAFNSVFTVGEELVYEINFGIISAGEARMRIPEIVSLHARDCFHIISEVKTSDFFSAFFKVDDRVESFMDVFGLFPWRYEKHIREGKYKADRSAVFDPLKARAYSGKDTIKTPAYSQDVLSIIYYLRTLDLEPGRPISIDNYEDKKFFPLTVQIKKKEKIKVPAGKFDCFLIEPGLRAGSFIEQKGKMWIWLSTDSRRIPVKIKSKLSFGSIVMELKKTTSPIN
jgi:hypothetical protein